MLKRLLILILTFGLCENALGQSTVVWISIDAFRHDYIERFHPPFLSKLASEGAYSTQVIPIFPSLTFPNHVAQETGATVDVHGVPLNSFYVNSFYDSTARQLYAKPDGGWALRAEPIWVTAKRQGLRVAVLDWPMSHAQTGENKSDYFWDRFDDQQSDSQRLERVAQILKSDHAESPLRLIMTYISRTDGVGHRSGPNSAEIGAAVGEVDAMLDKFVHSTVEWFDTAHSRQDDLYILLTSDHGMTPISTFVNFDRLVGADLMSGTKTIIGEPIATVFLTDVPADQKEQRAQQIVSRLKQQPFVSAWVAKEVPTKLHFADPTRIGEVVALLQPGYVWTEERIATTRPAGLGTNLGAHGYDPAVCPDMLGTTIVWHYKHPMGGKDLGPIDNTQWHATVARLLGIKPVETSDPRAVNLP
jgi:predicted AlkP superfamily pyrophosphatase or phosphodiesterase